jgi:hypothetical protein
VPRPQQQQQQQQAQPSSGAASRASLFESDSSNDFYSRSRTLFKKDDDFDSIIEVFLLLFLFYFVSFVQPPCASHALRQSWGTILTQAATSLTAMLSSLIWTERASPEGCRAGVRPGPRACPRGPGAAAPCHQERAICKESNQLSGFESKADETGRLALDRARTWRRLRG